MLIEDWLYLVKMGKQECVNKMVSMVTDLYRNGHKSRYRKHLFGPVHELKDRTRQGGARVYYIRSSDDEFILVHAECKNEDDANEQLLGDVADVLEAFESGKPVTDRPPKRTKKEER